MSGVPTIDQLKVFLTIADVGSFAEAGRTLNRSRSVISYSISNLEAQIGLALFERDAKGGPKLTEAGRMVLAEARRTLDIVDGLRAKAKGMRQGLESELRLVLDRLLSAAPAESIRQEDVLAHLPIDRTFARFAPLVERVVTPPASR